MPRNRHSYYIGSTGPQNEAIITGFRWLIKEAANQDRVGYVVVFTKHELDNISHWSQLSPTLNTLHKSGVYQADSVTLNLITPRDRYISASGPALVIYGGQELLDFIDSFQAITSVLYIPWQGQEHADWSATWNATRLGDDESQSSEQKEPLSGIVLSALESLTKLVNLSTGITHPSDREQAVRSLETLFHKQAQCDPETIRRQLIRLDWKPSDAAKVKEIADMIWDGRRPRKSTGRADEGLWKYWNERAS
ncbi:MAG: hypothetical protein RDU30_06570 [Desulfovibrionaceae bacterium]|nr:hypothetical protein [Desulfovibrionaceae bacterium]